MKRVWALILTAVMILSLAACGSSGNSGTGGAGSSAQGGTEETSSVSPELLKFALPGEPDGIYGPNVAYSLINGEVGLCVFDNLVEYDSDTQSIVPMMAESWEQPDAKTVIFHLRDDIYSAAGTHFTANDVLYNLSVGASMPTLGLYFQYFDLENSYAEDDYTVVIKLLTDYSTIVTTMSYSCFGMACKADVEAAGGPEAFSKNPVATGKYNLESWTSGSQMVLTKNENYYGEPAYFNKIELYFIPDTASRVIALQSHDVDATISLTAADKEVIDAEDNLSIMLVPGTTKILFFNFQNSYLANEKVRKALCYAIDKESVIQRVYSGIGTPNDNFFDMDNPYFTEPGGAQTYTYDIEKAKALLAEAGYPDGFDLSISVIQYQDLIDDAKVLQDCFAKIGVNLTIDTRDSGSFFSDMYSGNFDCFVIGASGVDPYTHVSYFNPDKALQEGNFLNYTSEAMSPLIAAARAEIDEAARKEAYAAMQEQLIKEAAAAGICDTPDVHAIRSDLTGKNEPMGALLIPSIKPAK